MRSAAAHQRLADVVASTGVVSGAAARERVLPVHPALHGLWPQGLQRGTVVGCAGPAAVSLALAVAAGPSQEGAWVFVAGLPTLGLAAAGELGIALDRLVHALEPEDEPWDDGLWGDVLGAAVDGFDVVLLGPGAARVRPGTVRRVAARLQARGAVAIVVEVPAFATDVVVRARDVRWHGLGDGHGVARARHVAAMLDGRRVPRPRHAELWLPAADGAIRPVDADGAVVPLRRTG